MHVSRAIILGVEHPRAVAAIQSLGRAGVPIVAVDHNRNALGFFSRYVTETFRITEDHDSALGLIQGLGKEGGGLLIPTNDHYLILASKHFDSLSRHLTLTTPQWDVMEPLMDVAECYRMAREIGLKTPAVLKPNDQAELESFVRSLDFRNQSYLLKTRPGTAPADARTGRFTKVGGSNSLALREDCLEIYKRIGEFPAIAKVVPGGADRCIGVCMVVDRNYEPAVCYCVRRLRLDTYSRGGHFIHPYELGANVYCESIHDDEAVEAAKKLVRKLRYYGPIAVEFRRDSTDESLTLIKADPRLVRATSLSTALRMDIPTTLYRVFVAGKASAPSTYADGVAWIWLSQYLTALWANRANRSILRELLILVKRISNIRAIANLDMRDPIPFLLEQKRWWFRFVKSAARKLSPW